MVCSNGTFGGQPRQPNVHALTILSASSFSTSNPVVFLSPTEDSVLRTVPSAAIVSFITILPVSRAWRASGGSELWLDDSSQWRARKALPVSRRPLAVRFWSRSESFAGSWVGHVLGFYQGVELLGAYEPQFDGGFAKADVGVMGGFGDLGGGVVADFGG